MITDIFKKNYLLELNTDLQQYIKSFLSYDEIILIYLNQYILDLKKRNKRFFNKVLKLRFKYDFDVLYKIRQDLTFDKTCPYFDFSYNSFADSFIKNIQRCIILKYLDLNADFIFLNKDNKKIITEYLKIITNFKTYSVTKYKRKQIHKLIDIYNEEDPNIFISKQYDHN